MAVMILVMLAIERRASGLRAHRTRPSLSESSPAFMVTDGSAEVEMLRSAAVRPSTSSLLRPADRAAAGSSSEHATKHGEQYRP